jgi:hypothetical protein
MKPQESLMMAPEDSTDYGPGGHRFNDDLLMAPESRKRALEDYPEVYHLLDHERLREAFRPRNQEANLAKKQSQAAGFWAVFLAALALIVAAAEPLWGPLADPIPRVIALVSALLGLVSFMIAALGPIYGKRKFRWLHAQAVGHRPRVGPAARRSPLRPSARAPGWEGRTLTQNWTWVIPEPAKSASMADQ